MESVVKNLTANAGDERDSGPIRGLGSPGEGHCNPLQYSRLENPRERGAWQAIVHKVTKSWTQLKRLNTQCNTNNNIWVFNIPVQYHQQTITYTKTVRSKASQIRAKQIPYKKQLMSFYICRGKRTDLAFYVLCPFIFSHYYAFYPSHPLVLALHWFSDHPYNDFVLELQFCFLTQVMWV